MPDTAVKAEPIAAPPERGTNPVLALLQTFVGLFVPFVLLAPFRFILAPRRPNTGFDVARVLLLLGFAGFWLMFLIGQAAMFAFLGFPPFKDPPKFHPLTISAIGWAMFRAFLGVVQFQLGTTVVYDWLFFRWFSNLKNAPPAFEAAVKLRMRFERSVYALIGTLFVVGFSLLPLAALLAALPLVSPNEAVLTDTVRPARSWWRRTARRVFAALAGLVVLAALLAFAIEVVSRLPLPEGGQLGVLAKKVLGTTAVDMLPERMMAGKQPDDVWPTSQELLDKRKTLAEARSRAARDQNIILEKEAKEQYEENEREIEERRMKSIHMKVRLDPQLSPWLAKPIWTLLPPALVQHWPFVFLIVYGTDLLLLLLIGRVPLAYNFRYLWVRKRDTLLTALAFTVVVALVVVLLAFVNGMYKLNESTGIPGNVMVLAEGSTDELFSNLARADAQDVERVEIAAPGGAKYTVARAVRAPGGALVPLPGDAPKETRDAVYLASLESYMVMNQAVPTKPGEPPRRRFLQVRALRDPQIAAAVHNMDLEPGGKWFSVDGVHQESAGKYLPCVIGSGVAGTLGEDAGKRRLEPGDTFELGDRAWIVTGVMKTEGTTFGSEIWVSENNNRVVQDAGKQNRYTTLVLRMADNTDAAARVTADYLNKSYTQAKLKAFAEPDYYKELTKTNETFLQWIVFLALVMAVGGIFGVMNTMFASIAARIKEVGVLRILGFKRWQILISFMIESLAIAFVGGLVGCALGYLANGFEAASTLSSGQGGGKSVILKMVVDYQTLAAGMLFTLVMGRLGGLVPALSAMRMEILDSLR